MGLRGWIKRLERDARGNLASFELLDGSRYYFDPASAALFLHWCECVRTDNLPDWPDPPEIVRKLCEARDVRRALGNVEGGGQFSTFVYDRKALINERRLEPRSLVAGRVLTIRR